MSNRFLYIAWAALYAACAGLGFIPNAQGVAQGLLIFFSLVFFVPPAILLQRAVKEKNIPAIRRIRNLALTWLILATVGICVNILSVGASATAGMVLYSILILTTAPMICGQFWVSSLFLWACLLVTSWKFLPKKGSK